MSDQFKTSQEAFWAGEFGDRYIERNQGPALLASNIAFFRDALRSTRGIDDCIEFGANIGMNLAALRLLYPSQVQHAVEINPEAVSRLRESLPTGNVHHASILDFKPTASHDLALIKGVLIHINPAFLPAVYDLLHAASRRYILLCEYYNPSPVTLSYRGHEDRLFKRDFCGEMLDRFPDLRLVDYGFAYRRDPCFPQDDITWFLLEK